MFPTFVWVHKEIMIINQFNMFVTLLLLFMSRSYCIWLPDPQSTTPRLGGQVTENTWIVPKPSLDENATQTSDSNASNSPSPPTIEERKSDFSTDSYNLQFNKTAENLQTVANNTETASPDWFLMPNWTWLEVFSYFYCLN